LSPKVNALAAILILVVMLASTLGWWFLYRAERRRMLDMQLANHAAV
jgi:putrescine transport system permease protein